VWSTLPREAEELNFERISRLQVKGMTQAFYDYKKGDVTEIGMSMACRIT
jgi:hypothetical protein